MAARMEADTGRNVSLRGKSLLIFDDALWSVDGHWFEQDLAVARAHVALGAEVTIMCHHSFRHSAHFEREGVKVLPVIARSVFAGDVVPRPGILGELWGIVSLGATFARALRRALKARRYDCVLVPNARIQDVLAWCMLRWLGVRNRAGRLVLHFRFGLGDYGSSGPPRFARKLRIWGTFLGCHRRDLELGRTALVTNSARLAQEYVAIAGVQPALMPSPGAPLAVARPEGETRDIVFASLGFARIDKGIDLLQAAIRVLSEDGRAEGMRFLIQWNRDVPLPDGSVYRRDPVLEASDRVEFLEQALSSEDYAALFGRIGCMVLPYRRSVYHSQVSGVGVEAACAGMPIIYTRDTWLEDFVGEQGAGVGIDDGNVEQLADAMAAIARERTRYREAAQERGAIARRNNSPEEFVRLLWAGSTPPGNAGEHL